VAVAPVVLGDHRAAADVEGGEQAGGAVPDVVMRHPRRRGGHDRQDRRSPVYRLHGTSRRPRAPERSPATPDTGPPGDDQDPTHRTSVHRLVPEQHRQRPRSPRTPCAAATGPPSPPPSPGRKYAPANTPTNSCSPPTTSSTASPNTATSSPTSPAPRQRSRTHDRCLRWLSA